jgi:hypothetical protein
MRRTLLAWDRTLALLACLIGIALVVAISDVAENSGDYGRVTRSFGLDFGVSEVPARCSTFTAERPIPPVSPLALMGVASAVAVRLAGLGCFPVPAWFALLSTVFWAGVLIQATHLRGQALAALCAGALAIFLLFAPMLYSFYEEAFFVVLLPWLPLARLGGRWRTLLALGVAFAALITKAQALFFVPILLAVVWPDGKRLRWWQAAGLALVVLAASGFNLLKSQHYGYMNGYNRIYNGVGWTALNVADWPPREYLSRSHLFYSTQADGLLSRDPRCAFGETRLLGTGYWPTGHAIQSGQIAVEPSDKESLRHLDLGDFLRCASTIGRPLVQVVQIYRVFLNSDYRLIYLRTAAPLPALAWLAGFRDIIMSWAGLISVAVAVALGVLLRSRFFVLSAAYILVGSPLFVVMGDGFYEFEKHMQLNFMMLAGCTFIAAWRRGSAAGT